MKFRISSCHRDKGYHTIFCGDPDVAVKKYHELEKAGEPVQLTIDFSGADDMPDFSDRLTYKIHEMIGLKVIGYCGELAISERFKEEQRALFPED